MKFILYYSISYEVVYMEIRSTDLLIAVTYKTYQQDSMSPYASSIPFTNACVQSELAS